MRCPYCQHVKTSVIETRESEETVRRRRECAGCRSRFTTYETARPAGLMVEGAHGVRLDFSRAWLQHALAAAGAELPAAALKKVAASVEAELKTRGSGIVSTQELASAAVRELVQGRAGHGAGNGAANGARSAARGNGSAKGNGYPAYPTAEQVGAALDSRFGDARRLSDQLPLPIGK